MEIQSNISNTCQNFLACIQQDTPTARLYKYRHFLSTHETVALEIFNKMTLYALNKNLLGQYQAIYDLVKRVPQKTGLYKQMRQQMVDFTNPIRNQTQHAQSIGNLQEMANGYFKLAEYYKKIGMHKQSTNYYTKLFRVQSGNKIIYQRWQYFSSWAQQLWFDNNWTDLNIFLRNDIQDPKKVDCTLSLIKDLKFIQTCHISNSFFQNVLTANYPISQIIQNRIISFIDLGTIYSLVALAKKSRQFLKVKTLWSGKFEVLYLQNNFSGLLEKIHSMYEKQGKFHPLIDKIYQQMFKRIRERVLTKYLQAFTSISLAQVQQNTTFSQGQLRLYLKNHNDLPYVIDPINKSVVYQQKSIPLYDEAMGYSLLTKQKFKQQVRVCLTNRKNQESEIGVGFMNRFSGRQEGGGRGNFGNPNRGFIF